jgi:cell wall assembly regulator SMI1
MTDALIQFSKFTDTFNKNEETQTVSLQDIQLLEDALKIKLPEDFKLFMNQCGNVWAPDILDIIVNNELEMNDIQQFMTPDEIIDDKRSGSANQIKKDVIPFALDSMGNMYVFKTSDIRNQKQTAKIYFYDHDFDKLHAVSNSFTDLIEEFNTLL